MAQQTAVEWLVNELLFIQSLKEGEITESNKGILTTSTIEQAKQMEKEQMIEFAEFVASYPSKNRNYKGYMLHAKSKYDGAERTIDLLEEYYNETYNKPKQ